MIMMAATFISYVIKKLHTHAGSWYRAIIKEKKTSKLTFLSSFHHPLFYFILESLLSSVVVTLVVVLLSELRSEKKPLRK